MITNTKVSLDKVIHTHAIFNTPPNTPNIITKDKSTNQDKSTNHVYKTYPCEVSDKLLIPKQQITDNIHSTTKQTLMTINNTNQQDKINLAKKQMQTINRTTQNWLKVESKEVIHEEFPPYESIIINHRNQQLLASPIKNVSLVRMLLI